MIADRMISRMIKVLGSVAILAFALSIASPSVADDTDNTDTDDTIENSLYIEYTGGLSSVPNQRLVGADASGAGLSGDAESNPGFNVGAAFGKRFHKFVRAELQLSYRQSEVTNLALQGENDNAQGEIGLLAIMVNGYVDYDLEIGVIPYVGVGIGWGSLEIDAKNAGGALKARVEGQDSIFVWSLMVGGTIPVNEVMDLSLGYRYIATTEADINSDVLNRGSRRLEAEYDAHEIVGGVRFSF